MAGTSVKGKDPDYNFNIRVRTDSHTVDPIFFNLRAKSAQLRSAQLKNLRRKTTSENVIEDGAAPVEERQKPPCSHNVLVSFKAAWKPSRQFILGTLSSLEELASEYETAKKAQERATENATSNFTKRRGIARETKQYREQKCEADTDLIRYDNLRTIVKKNKDLGDLRQERSIHEKALESVPADQAKARTTVMQKEENGENAAKVLDGKLSMNDNLSKALTREEETVAYYYLSPKKKASTRKRTTQTEKLHQQNEEVEPSFISFSGTKNRLTTNGVDEYSTGARQQVEKGHRLYRATFSPIGTIQVKLITDKSCSFAKGARLAWMLYSVKQLLGGLYIMRVGTPHGYEKGQEAKAVTLEGTVIHKSRW
ncbi:hypothetical protein BYT27DRAFT_7298972 [Phlegmacium glaucopus]|nr:hypothetical protein BYT27DRAFT_7298972 [Phlegmacium glaucopus]